MYNFQEETYMSRLWFYVLFLDFKKFDTSCTQFKSLNAYEKHTCGFAQLISSQQ